MQYSPDGEDDHHIIESNSRVVRKAADNASLCLRRLFKKLPELRESQAPTLELLEAARRTGEPPLIMEYYRRQSHGRRLLNGFRLTRFWSVLDQLDSDISGLA